MMRIKFSSGDTTRTCDLRVMSPTSYLLLYPAILDCKYTTNIYKYKKYSKNSLFICFSLPLLYGKNSENIPGKSTRKPYR